VSALLRECLDSVFRDAAAARLAVEVVVVDNASRDDTLAMLARYPTVRVIANRDNVGFGRANNQALARVHGELILLLNPDTVVLPGALRALVAVAHARADVAIVGARLLNTDGSLQRWTGGAFPSIWNVACHYLFLGRALPRAWQPSSLYLDRDRGEDTDVDWVSGACLLLRRSAVGTFIFDERFFLYGEDMDLCHRVRASGRRIVYTPRATIVHHQGASMKQQQGDVLLASLKGPRQFFATLSPGPKVLVYDALTVAGFLLRWIANAVAGHVLRSPRHRARAQSSRRYLAVALKVAGGR
jgi:GT2 family glycosyltransferase